MDTCLAVKKDFLPVIMETFPQTWTCGHVTPGTAAWTLSHRYNLQLLLQDVQTHLPPFSTYTFLLLLLLLRFAPLHSFCPGHIPAIRILVQLSVHSLRPSQKREKRGDVKTQTLPFLSAALYPPAPPPPPPPPSRVHTVTLTDGPH